MSAQQSQTKTTAKPTSAPVSSGLLQRRCACGNHTVAGNECEECSKQSLTLQRASLSPNEWEKKDEEAPPIVHEVLRSPGQPLDAATRSFFEPRFGYDFSQVRVHTDAKAAESARVLNTLIHNVGPNMVHGRRQYLPQTITGKRPLLPLTNPGLQAKLKISQPEDPAEEQANRLAERIVINPVRLADKMTSKRPKPGYTCTEAAICHDLAVRELHRETQFGISSPTASLGKGVELPAHRIEPAMLGLIPEQERGPELSELESRITSVTSTAGEPLPESTRDFFEQQFGFDFHSVRIHRDGTAWEMANALKARAYTMKNDIMFGRNEYQPETTEGKKLLAHELIHVVQQRGADSFYKTSPLCGPASNVTQISLKPDDKDNTDDTSNTVSIPIIDPSRLLPSTEKDIWIAVNKGRLCVLPPNSIFSVVKKGDIKPILPEEPLMSKPTIGKAGLQIVKVGDKEGFMIDAGGKPSVLFPEGIAAIAKSLGIEKIEGVIITHAHQDHIQSLINIIKEFKILPKNIIFPEAMLDSPKFSSWLQRLEQDRDLQKLGYGKTSYNIIPKSQGQGFTHYKIETAQVTFDFYWLNDPLNKQRNNTNEDRYSPLIQAFFHRTNTRMLFMGDLRLRDLELFRVAMGETQYNRILSGVTVISDLHHHLGVLDKKDLEQLKYLIEHTFFSTGSLTIASQTQYNKKDNTLLNMASELARMGIKIELALTPEEQITQMKYTTKDRFIHEGGGRSEKIEPDDFFIKFNKIVIRLGKLNEMIDSNPQTINLKKNIGDAYDRLDFYRKQYLEKLLLYPKLIPSLNNRIGLELENEKIADIVKWSSEITREKINNLNIYLRELNIAVERKMPLSNKGIEALWEFDPETGKRLLLESGLSKSEQLQVRNQMYWRPVPAKYRVGSALMLSLVIWNDIVQPAIEIYQSKRQESHRENVQKALVDILWWQDKGVSCNMEARKNDQYTKDEKNIYLMIGQNSIDYLGMVGINDNQLGNYEKWLEEHVKNYLDWFYYFSPSSNKTLKREGKFIDTSTWCYRKTTIVKGKIFYSVKEEWVQSEKLTKIMNDIEKKMATKSEEEIFQIRWKSKPTEATLSNEGHTSFSIYSGKPRASDIKQFREVKGKSDYELYTIHKHSRRGGFSLEDMFLIFPDALVTKIMKLTKEVPDEYVVVGGATYATYVKIFNAMNDKVNLNWSGIFDAAPLDVFIRPNITELLLAKQSDLFPQ